MELTRRRAVLLALIVVAVSRFGGSLTNAQERSSVITSSDTLFVETSGLRELPIRRPVTSVSLSRSEIEQFAIRKFDEQTTADEVRAAELTLKMLGLVPRDFAYRSFFAALMKEQVAGAYDPATRQMQMPDWMPLGAQAPVLVHELTHALQDQHFDLSRLERWQEGDSDAQLAAHSLAEGDAMLVMAQYLLRKPEAAATLLKSAIAMADTPVFNAAPAALRETLAFPYEYGVRFVAELYTSGQWAGVSAAYARLPLSTEHVMHPAKYSMYEAPTPVKVPDVAAALGRAWTRLDGDVQGEWGYYQILKAFLPAGDRAARAAAGWGGDRYAIYTGPRAGDAVLVQMSAWDTETDAAEFFEAYLARTEARYAVPSKASPSDAAGVRRRRWSTGAGEAVVELRGTRVVTIEGIPGDIDTDALIAATWR